MLILAFALIQVAAREDAAHFHAQPVVRLQRQLDQILALEQRVVIQPADHRRALEEGVGVVPRHQFRDRHAVALAQLGVHFRLDAAERRVGFGRQLVEHGVEPVRVQLVERQAHAVEVVVAHAPRGVVA